MNRLEQLFTGYAAGSLSAEELREFLSLLDSEETGVEQGISQLLQKGRTGLSLAGTKEELWQGIQAQMRNNEVPVVSLRTGRWSKWIAAASVIILFGVGAYLWNNYSTKPEPNTAAIQPSSSDILPGRQRAILTLANGRQIILDSAANGQLATENGSEITKLNDQIVYGSPPIPSNGGVGAPGTNMNKNKSYGASEVGFNTMSTPRGGQYQLTLSDGTRVWLNAASSITYPTSFTTNTREVKISGEVYFEVAANKSKPFIVQSGDNKITVLGTSFNINNYPDEPSTKISLINGAIKVNDKLLSPGQAYSNGKIINTNTEQDIAWKKGYLNIQGADIKTVMRSISRWYDVEIKYKREIQDKFYIDISTNTSLSDVLKILEATGKVKPFVEGRTVILE